MQLKMLRKCFALSIPASLATPPERVFACDLVSQMNTVRNMQMQIWKLLEFLLVIFIRVRVSFYCQM